jgi:hypothetical protein
MKEVVRGRFARVRAVKRPHRKIALVPLVSSVKAKSKIMNLLLLAHANLIMSLKGLPDVTGARSLRPNDENRWIGTPSLGQSFNHAACIRSGLGHHIT